MATPFPFVSGAVLTAAQQNAITTLPITAKTASATLTAAESVGYRVTMSNASATTITINSAVYGVGDTIFIANIGAGSTVLTAGSGVTLSTAGSLTIVQNQGGMLVMTSSTAGTFYPTAVTATAAALVYITGASFSAASQVSLPTSTFTATYENYRIVYDISASSTNLRIDARLRASGTDITASNYGNVTLGVDANNVASPICATSVNTWYYDYVRSSLNNGHITIDVYAPQLTQNTKVGGFAVGSNASYTFDAGFQINGWYAATTSADSLSLNATTGTITGSYKVYGYSNS